MKALIIGFGSIGKRHHEILKDLNGISSISIVSKYTQSTESLKIYDSLDKITNLSSFDYYVIASETAKHHEQLEYLCSKVSNKSILVEKPLYEKVYPSYNCSNKVFTAYNLRFHPALLKLRKILKNEKVLYVNAICGQYLPSWRPDQDYTKSYSADLSKGGGVLRDLSHELDYLSWIFGRFSTIHSLNTKISDLDINSDDLFTAIAVTNKKVVVNVTIDYISKKPIRKLLIHTQENTIEVDIVENQIHIHSKTGKETSHSIPKEHRNYTYTKMHEAILSNTHEIVCSYEEGKNIVNYINNVEFKEL